MRYKLLGKSGLKVSELALGAMTFGTEMGITPTQVAIAWLIRAPANIIPLVGARTAEQLTENLGCLDVTLGDEQMERLNDVSAISPGFPHDMLSAQSDARGNRIINHRNESSGGYL